MPAASRLRHATLAPKPTPPLLRQTSRLQTHKRTNAPTHGTATNRLRNIPAPSGVVRRGVCYTFGSDAVPPRAATQRRDEETSDQMLLNSLWIVPILGVLILVHELGHFFAARLVGIRVEEFGL